MPVIKSAKKALKRSRRNKVLNDRKKRAYKEAIKLFKSTPTKELLAKVFSKLDVASSKNVIHKNKAGRLKSSLSKLLSIKHTS